MIDSASWGVVCTITQATQSAHPTRLMGFWRRWHMAWRRSKCASAMFWQSACECSSSSWSCHFFLIFALKMHPSVVTVLSMHRSYEEEANQRLDKEMEDSETRSIQNQELIEIMDTWDARCDFPNLFQQGLRWMQEVSHLFKWGQGNPQAPSFDRRRCSKHKVWNQELWRGRTKRGAELYHDLGILLAFEYDEILRNSDSDCAGVKFGVFSTCCFFRDVLWELKFLRTWPEPVPRPMTEETLRTDGWKPR